MLVVGEFKKVQKEATSSSPTPLCFMLFISAQDFCRLMLKRMSLLSTDAEKMLDLQRPFKGMSSVFLVSREPACYKRQNRAVKTDGR